MSAGADAVAPSAAVPGPGVHWRTAGYLGAAALLTASAAAQSWPKPWALVALAIVVPLGTWGILSRAERPWLLPLVGCLDTLAGFDVFLGLGLFALALRRRDRLMVGITALGATAITLAALLTPTPSPAPPGTSAETLAWLTWGGAMVVQVVVPVLVGGWLGTQRDLVVNLQARTLAAEAARRSRDREAVLQERERIAHEMHDALGHQLALVAMHAGALGVNAGAGPDAVRDQAEVIRATARQALVDLRHVVGALQTAEPPSLSPAAGMAAVRQLVATSGQVTDLRFHDDVPSGATVPEPTARAVFRIVQEGLTNAHRHAPGAPIEVVLRGEPGAGLEMVLVNGLSTEAMPGGNGTGLAALAERVRVLGGSLQAAREPDRFRLTARLPWPRGEE